MELPSSNIKKFLIFSYIPENANTKKNPYISRNGNPKIVSCISGFRTLHFLAQLEKKFTPRKFLIL